MQREQSPIQSIQDYARHHQVVEDCRDDGNTDQSPIVVLNSWANDSHTSIRYVLINEQSLSRSLFSYRVYLGDDFYFDGHASTDQQARINCALNALYFLRQNHFSTPPSSPSSQQTKSPISLMYERAQQLALPVRFQSIDSHTISYFLGEKYFATGHGFNRHAAKQSAAEKLLRILPQCDPLTRIYQLAQIRQVKLEFLPIPTEENYRYRIKFGEKDQAEGDGRTKQSAKRTAAEMLLTKLESIAVLPPPPAKGLLKREGSKYEKKHVHFLDEIIEKDEQTSFRPKSINRNKQQLNDLCQKLQIHLQYLDRLVRRKPSIHLFDYLFL